MLRKYCFVRSNRRHNHFSDYELGNVPTDARIVCAEKSVPLKWFCCNETETSFHASKRERYLLERICEVQVGEEDTGHCKHSVERGN